MVSRGPAISHVRPTNNPFMTTSAGVVGLDVSKQTVYDAPEIVMENEEQKVSAAKAQLKHFMYKKSSQAIGDYTEAEKHSKLSKRMDKVALKKEIDEKGLVQIRKIAAVQPKDLVISPDPLLPPTLDMKLLSSQKKQHPMYTTSHAEIGAEKTEVKVQVERISRPNDFTASFNGFRYRDFGLNTAITKSRICDRLDI